jgi:hypothetical protein
VAGIDFDDLHFTESLLGAPVLVGEDLIVAIAQLYVVRGAPLLSEGPLTGRLVFGDVRMSGRQVYEYVGAPTSGDGFKAPYLIEDLERGEGGRTFVFEGVQQQPMAWVTWTVRANAFALELD